MIVEEEVDVSENIGGKRIEAPATEDAAAIAARLQAQEDAVQAVFDDIRSQSRSSSLVQPSRWAEQEFAPSHMTDPEFADLVFETLGYRTHADAREHARTASAEVSETEAKPASPHPDEPPSAGNGAASLPCADIVILEGGKSRYLYSRTCMTDAYANWSYLALEDDKTTTLVQCAREESRVYPRPMLAASLMNDPFDLTEDDISNAWQAISESDSYPDIRTCSASNGDVYFYSADYLSPIQAEALAEWYSVERPMAL